MRPNLFDTYFPDSELVDGEEYIQSVDMNGKALVIVCERRHDVYVYPIYTAWREPDNKQTPLAAEIKGIHLAHLLAETLDID